MAYNSAIPQSTSKRQISQRQILFNFQAIGASFAQNHAALGIGNQGQHTVVLLRPQGSNPTTGASQVAFYQKLVTYGAANIPNWFYRPSSNQTPIQMSYPSIKTGSQFSDQYSFSAGPFVIYGGKVTNPSNGQTVTLTPVTTLRYVGLAVTNVQNPTATALAVAIPTSISGNSFNISFQTKPGTYTYDVFYVAIGN